MLFIHALVAWAARQHGAPEVGPNTKMTDGVYQKRRPKPERASEPTRAALDAASSAAADASETLSVALRVRPGSDGTRCLSSLGPRSIAVQSTSGSAAGHAFEVEHVLWGSADQQAVWQELDGQRTLVEHLLSGRSAAVLAVGPSGGGKSHTLTGKLDDPGISLRVLRALLERRNHVALRVELSALEVRSHPLPARSPPHCPAPSPPRALGLAAHGQHATASP